MKLLQRYIITEFIPVCVVALLFFVLLLELGDLFANLWKYLANGVEPKSILSVMWLYAPKCVSYAMPMAVLFASSYTMGSFYARNELTVVFSSGFPLHRLIAPLLAIGFLLSIAMFFFEDRVVIATLGKKNALVKTLVNQENSLSNSNVVVLSENREILYSADYYQDIEKKLFSLTIVGRDGDGELKFVLQSPQGSWDGDEWILLEPSVYYVGVDGSVTYAVNEVPLALSESPDSFKRNTTSVEELSSQDAREFIKFLRRAGIPHTEQLSNYYKRFSFPFTIFIVLFFSISLGGRFKKNVLLMSLLLSISVAVVYYVVQMIAMIMAKWEYITPLSGAWIPVILFVGGGFFTLKYART